MGTVIRLERPSNAGGAPVDTSQVNVVQLSPSATKDLIVRTAGTCETSRQSIVALQANLKTLGDIADVISDPETRETLQHQMKIMGASLGLRLAESSSIELMLQASFTAYTGQNPDDRPHGRHRTL